MALVSACLHWGLRDAVPMSYALLQTLLQLQRHGMLWLGSSGCGPTVRGPACARLACLTADLKRCAWPAHSCCGPAGCCQHLQ